MCWKFIDPLEYVKVLALKSSVNVFSLYVSCVERHVACVQVTLSITSQLQIQRCQTCGKEFIDPKSYR